MGQPVKCVDFPPEINEKIRFGKPIIGGTRITVDEVLGALAGGMTYEEIEEEYGLTKEDILAIKTN